MYSLIDIPLSVFLLTRATLVLTLYLCRADRKSRELQTQLEEEMAINRRVNEEIAIITKKYKNVKQEYDETVSSVRYMLLLTSGILSMAPSILLTSREWKLVVQ